MVSCQGCGEATDSRLCCPTCESLGRTSVFCSQDCFVLSWASHSKLHQIIRKNAQLELKAVRGIEKSQNPLRPDGGDSASSPTRNSSSTSPASWNTFQDLAYAPQQQSEHSQNSSSVNENWDKALFRNVKDETNDNPVTPSFSLRVGPADVKKEGDEEAVVHSLKDLNLRELVAIKSSRRETDSPLKDSQFPANLAASTPPGLSTSSPLLNSAGLFPRDFNGLREEAIGRRLEENKAAGAVINSQSPFQNAFQIHGEATSESLGNENSSRLHRQTSLFSSHPEISYHEEAGISVKRHSLDVQDDESTLHSASLTINRHTFDLPIRFKDEEKPKSSSNFLVPRNSTVHSVSSNNNQANAFNKGYKIYEELLDSSQSPPPRSMVDLSLGFKPQSKALQSHQDKQKGEYEIPVTSNSTSRSRMKSSNSKRTDPSSQVVGSVFSYLLGYSDTVNHSNQFQFKDEDSHSIQMVTRNQRQKGLSSHGGIDGEMTGSSDASSLQGETQKSNQRIYDSSKSFSSSRFEAPTSSSRLWINNGDSSGFEVEGQSMGTISRNLGTYHSNTSSSGSLENFPNGIRKGGLSFGARGSIGSTDGRGMQNRERLGVYNLGLKSANVVSSFFSRLFPKEQAGEQAFSLLDAEVHNWRQNGANNKNPAISNAFDSSRKQNFLASPMTSSYFWTFFASLIAFLGMVLFAVIKLPLRAISKTIVRTTKSLRPLLRLNMTAIAISSWAIFLLLIGSSGYGVFKIVRFANRTYNIRNGSIIGSSIEVSASPGNPHVRPVSGSVQNVEVTTKNYENKGAGDIPGAIRPASNIPGVANIVPPAAEDSAMNIHAHNELAVEQHSRVESMPGLFFAPVDAHKDAMRRQDLNMNAADFTLAQVASGRENDELGLDGMKEHIKYLEARIEEQDTIIKKFLAKKGEVKYETDSEASLLPKFTLKDESKRAISSLSSQKELLPSGAGKEVNSLDSDDVMQSERGHQDEFPAIEFPLPGPVSPGKVSPLLRDIDHTDTMVEGDVRTYRLSKGPLNKQHVILGAHNIAESGPGSDTPSNIPARNSGVVVEAGG